MGGFVAFRRKRTVKHWNISQWMMLLLLLLGTAGLTACGGGSSGSGSTLASPGNSIFTVIATDSSGGASQSLDINIIVQ
jgi:hypothetical protein